jgi:hypothetical protein
LRNAACRKSERHHLIWVKVRAALATGSLQAQHPERVLFATGCNATRSSYKPAHVEAVRGKAES